MTYSYSKGVGRIFADREPKRFWCAPSAKQGKDGFLYLQLIGSPIASHCGLNLSGVIFINLQSSLCRCEEDYSARFTQTKRALYVIGDKSLF
jgi:hypothetical protein